MLVYHCSSKITKEPEIEFEHCVKEFGPGFYVFFEKEDATSFFFRDMSTHRCELGIYSKDNPIMEPTYMNVYRIPHIDVLGNKLKICKLESRDEDWLEQVADMEFNWLIQECFEEEDYDCIYGPVNTNSHGGALVCRDWAADDAGPYYMDGKKYYDMESVLQSLKNQKLTYQVCFASEKARNHLEFITAERIG